MENRNGAERNRTFLTYAAIIIAFLSLALYAFIRDPSLLALAGISGVGLATVYRFYFTDKK